MRLFPSSIKWQMVVVTAIAFPVTLFAFGWLSLGHVRDSSRITADYQMALTRRIAHELDSKLEAAQNALAALSRQVSPAILPHREITKTWLDERTSIKAAFFDQGLFLFDREGRLLGASSDISDAVLPTEFTRWVKLTARIEEPIISTPFWSGGTSTEAGAGARTMVSLVTAPVTGTNGEILGVLAGALNMNRENMLGSVARLKLGETGYFFMTSWDNTLVMHPDASLLMRKDIRPVPAPLLERASHGFRGAVETTAQNGEAVLSTLTKLQSTGWVLGANHPTGEAYGAFHQQQREVAAFIGIGILIASLITWLLMRLFVTPLGRLAADIEAIDVSGEHLAHVEVSGNALEITRLANTFNHLLVRLNEDRKRMALSASVFENAHEGIMITDADLHILSVNDAFTGITGYPLEEVWGKNPGILRSGRHDQAFYREMWHSIACCDSWRGEIWNRRRNGEIYPELLNINAVRNEDGGISHYVAIFSDITEIKHTQNMLEAMATTDVLTGLPNRALLADRLEQAMAHSRRLDRLLAIAFIDLDGFKAVNDSAGHHFGDHLLVEVAERFKTQARAGDTVARLGGDEFVLLITDVAEQKEILIALQRILQEISRPYEIDGRSVSIGASIGVTLFPHDNADPETLIRHADQAMYQAKNEGRGRIHIFDAAQDREIQTRHQQVERIRAGLQDGEMLLYYQPKVNMLTGRAIGAEALLRWRHPEQGILVPPQFLSLFFDHEIIVEIGDWVIIQALRQMEEWQESAGLTLPVSINLSARHLIRPGFADDLHNSFQRHPALLPEWLEIEILESDALLDIGHVQRTIEECQRFGVTFALDDFGTGYSSLAYLKNIPANTLKIDRSFVHNMLDDPDDLAIVQGVVQLAEVFERQVVAEGVETLQHEAALVHLGCTLAQGYGIARPMPPADIPAWVIAYESGEGGIKNKLRKLT
jgi:diguanylate cyclase (GGDEF)-like protein/PAS domain S-box-containing protein